MPVNVDFLYRVIIASNSIILKPAVMSEASAGISISIRLSIMQAIAKKKLMH